MIDPTVSVVLHPTRDLEVWLSQALGVSLSDKQQNLTKPDKTQETEI